MGTRAPAAGAAAQPRNTPADLFGREPALLRIQRLLAAAREGRGASLLLVGEPGIGKTALLDVAERTAGDAQVVRTVGIEAEADLPFAALGEVATPLLDHLDRVSERQAAALKAALAIGPSAAVAEDRLAVSAGLLCLLSAAARSRPLLVVVDDAHWLDSASAGCLGYAARRLAGTRVALVAACRSGTRLRELESPPTSRLPLEPLQADHAEALLRSVAGELAPSTERGILDAAAGNPLALVELPSLLTDDQRRGRVAFDPTPGPGGALWNAFERQITGLDTDGRRAMLVAAASVDHLLGPVVGACRDMGLDPSVLEDAEACGLLELEGGRLAFSHPLLRAVVYRSAPAPERRRAHAALAGHAAEDAAAWHLASAAVGPDEGAAAALEAAAARASGRGAHAAAADALERAAGLSGEPGDRWRRLLGAGLGAAMGGAYDRAAALLESVEEIEDRPLRAGTRHLLAMVTLNGGAREARANHELLTAEGARVAGLDTSLAATIHADAGVTAVVAGDCRLALRSAETARALLPADAPAPARAQVLSIHGMALALRGRATEARAALDEAAALLARVDAVSPAAQSICFALHARICTCQAAELEHDARELAETGGSAGTAGIVPYFRLVAADAACRRGRLEEAGRDVTEAIAIGEDTGQVGPLSIALAVHARVLAVRGEEQAARQAAERAIALADPPGYASTAIWAHSALGFLDLCAGRPAAGAAELEQAGRLAEQAALEDPVIVPWQSDLVEAYAQSGQAGRAARACEELDRRAERAGQPLGLALATRCRGILAEQDFADLFVAALALHERCDAPLEHGRTLLAFGSRLHRARRRAQARETLRAALEIFDGLGAAPLAARTRSELRAAGAVRRRPRDARALTAQERRVALGAARGATNRELAAELYLSPKTIEFHLGRVYRKLGIRSRTELAALVAEGRVRARERSH